MSGEPNIIFSNMKKKVIDLEIIEDLEESGVEKISLVDRPAIEVQWFAFEEEFIEPNPCWEGYEAYGTKIVNGREVPNCIKIQNKEEKFVEPSSGESQSDFMSRCVPYMIDEGKEQDQAVAICISTYERMSYDTSNLPPYVEQVPKKRKLHFVNEDEQIIVAPVMIPNIEIMRKDPDTKEIYYVKFSEQVIRKTAEKFMKELRNRETNIQHEENEAGSYVFESWIIDNLEDKANTHYEFNLPVGTWMVAMRVEDPNTWKMVKEGKLTGLSLEGNFMDREDYDRLMKDREIYEKIMNILGEK
jgi:hypothetical protein